MGRTYVRNKHTLHVRPAPFSASFPSVHFQQVSSTVMEEDFEGGNAGASDTTPLQCSALRKNGHVVIKGRPCKIVDMSTSKTGKHGHAKVHLVALDIFNGKKYEDICPSTHNVEVPNVSRTDLQLCDITDDGFLSLMKDDGDCREDIRCPEGDVGKEIRKAHSSGDGCMVTILSAMGEEMAVGTKNLSNNK